MYKGTSQRYKNTIYNPSVQSVVNIYIDNVLLNPKYIIDFKSGCEDLFGDNLELGSVPSQYVEIQIHKKSGITNPKTIKIEYGILVNNALTVAEVNSMLVKDFNNLMVRSLSKKDNSFEMIPIGIYNVDDYNSEDDNVINIKALDNIIKLDADDGYYDASEIINEKGYATLGEIAQDICDKKGLVLETSSFLNSNNKISVYDNQIKARGYMSYIAEKAGGFCCANREGKICFKKIGQDTAEIPLRLFKTYKFGEEYKVSRVAYEDGARSFKFGNETRNTLWIRQENLFVTAEKEIEDIYNEVKDLTINSFEGTVLIDPAIDIGDKIKIGDKYIIYQGEMTLSKRFIADIKSKISIKQRQETTVKKENQKIINRRVLSELNQIDGKITQLAEENTETSSKLTQHEQTINSITDRVSSVETKTETVESTAIISVSVEYALGTSTTTAPTASWSTTAPAWENGKYMWQRTILTYANGNTETSNATCIAGANGQDGIGISAIQEQYYLSTSNTELTGGSWKSIQDTWNSGKYIWTRNKIEWSDNTTTYTEPILATGINNANEKAESVDNDLKTNYYTKEETNSQITQESDAVMVEVNKKVNENELGTKIEQNYEHVKVAWNNISDFIQMMLIDGNASLAILDENEKVIMSLDKTGQHFHESEQKFGEMGVKKENNNKYIAFSVDSEYDSSTGNGMAWGITTKSDNKFWPVFYIKDFYMPPKNSGGVMGDLILSSGRFILDSINAALVVGGITINGDELDGIFFTDTTGNAGTLLQISKGNILEKPSINILNGVIRFYSNAAGTSSFKIGTDENRYCLLDDDGYLYCNDLHVNEDSTFHGRIDCYNTINCTGNVYGKNISSDKRLKKNIKKSKNGALQKINQIKVKSFDWKEDNKHIDYGFIAQEVEEIDENFVLKQEVLNKNKEVIDYRYYINTLSILATTVKAMQEQQEQIKELQEKDKQKDKIIQDLLKRVEILEKEANI